MAYPVSAGWDVTRSHRRVVRVIAAGVELDVTGGTVDVDLDAAVRRRCTLNLADPTMAPDTLSSLLAPAGNEVTVERGIGYPDGTAEYVPVGVFRIEQPTVADGRLTLTGRDRAATVSRDPFSDTYTVAAGTNVNTAATTIVTDTIPSVLSALDPVDDVTPGVVVADAGDDRWKLARTLIAAAGRILYFDPEGVLVSRPMADAGASVVSWSRGVNLLSASRTLSAEATVSRVVVLGESTGATTPVRGVAEDTDPSSPTYIDGPFGAVTEVVTSKLVTTQAQANAYAAALLDRRKGAAESATVQVVPDPRIGVGDTVTVNDADHRIAGLWTVAKLTVPLAASGVMTVDLRRKVTT